MPGRYEQHDASEEEWDEEDSEAPQEDDLTDDADDETLTVPCPHCRQPVPDFADRCPYCGDWIVQSAGPSGRHRPWFIALVILALLIVLAWVFR